MLNTNVDNLETTLLFFSCLWGVFLVLQNTLFVKLYICT